MIRYNMRVENCDVLGPGNRAVIWTQGCSRIPPCKNCIGESARDPRGGTIASVAEMVRWLLDCRGITGITLTGGEPFDQAEGIERLIVAVREVRPELDLIIYTGYTYDDLIIKGEDNACISRLLEQTQILIDGPYVEELNDGIPYRGSSNQRIRVLDPSYVAVAQEYYVQSKGRRIQILADRHETRMVGVPSLDQAAYWRNLKRSAID